MKQREPRHSVVVPARMRATAGWTDATILNLSNYGLMLRAPVTLERGHYLELRRGSHVIVARVVWSDGLRCGARAQSLIPVADLVLDRAAERGKFLPVERRSARRTHDHAERNRLRSRAAEYFIAGIAAACAAMFVADLVSGIFAKPIAAVELALAGKTASDR